MTRPVTRDNRRRILADGKLRGLRQRPTCEDCDSKLTLSGFCPRCDAVEVETDETSSD